MDTTTALPEGEFRARLERVREEIASADVDAGIWFGARSIEYLTRFYHAQTEPPVCLVVTDTRVDVTVPAWNSSESRRTPTSMACTRISTTQVGSR